MDIHKKPNGMYNGKTSININDKSPFFKEGEAENLSTLFGRTCNKHLRLDA